ncbi:cardiolipin synthase (CMP-forming) [Sinocyclocheilus grahami]|uniref:cardiolipin synthase (CMP-forming) n=1 Tax=Sinocyclocheilus grahami TaxID=75366 RepID=UPI0007ACFE62|nr:PREDICTED: cardiolipin synthase (CMP-forming) [Sinocyclocheilus grahami]
MLLAACRKSWLSCAKGRTHRLAASTAATCHYSCHDKTPSRSGPSQSSHAVFYVRYKTVPPPVTVSKFFNPCYTTARLKPTLISKINTAVQLFLVSASLAAPVFHYTDSVLLQSLWYITALTTAASGYSYYHYGKKTVEVLNDTK